MTLKDLTDAELEDLSLNAAIPQMYNLLLEERERRWNESEGRKRGVRLRGCGCCPDLKHIKLEDAISYVN